MTRLRSLLYNALFLLWSVGMHVISIPLLFGPGAGIYLVGGIWARGCVLLLRAVCGLGYRIEGLENLPDRPVVIAAKHQSIWETLAFCHIFQKPMFVLKQELLTIPFYGWYLKRMGMIAIDRQGGASALRRMLAEAQQTLDAGKHIVIFPEGTRTEPGQRRAYHPGVAALYKQLGVPVLPVALNSGLFWPAKSFRQKPGQITVKLLPPLPPGMDRREFIGQLERAIEDASLALLPDQGCGGDKLVDNSVGKS